MTNWPPRIVAIVQARMGSSRLPGKTLCDIAGRPLLGHVLDRVRASTLVTETIVATTERAEDQPVVNFATANSVPCYRGSADDVLDRFYHAALAFNADVIVRVTADDPFKDPAIIDLVITALLENPETDYASNTLQPTFPEGLDVEVFRIGGLFRAWREAQQISEREHVTPFLWKHPDRFRINSIRHHADLSKLRWTIDYPADLKFVREIYARLYHGQIFAMDEILDLLQREPQLQSINSDIVRNTGYAASLDQDRSLLRSADIK